MKKVVLFIAQVFFVFNLSAQHIDNVTQTGDDNYSLVNQKFTESSMMLSGNMAAIVQTGNSNSSDVYQETYGFMSPIPEDPGFAPDGNRIGVNQVGNYNIAKVSQIWKANFGLINTMGSYNIALLEQRGIYNEALVNQQFDYNKATIKTFGQYNKSIIIQTSVPGNSESTKNEAIQLMGSDNGLSDMVESSVLTSLQSGIDNYSLQEIQGSPVAGSSIENKGNTGDIIQIGNQNKAEQKMYNGKGTVANNAADLLQQGNTNESLQYIKGSVNTTSHVVIGSNNMTYTYQNWP